MRAASRYSPSSPRAAAERKFERRLKVSLTAALLRALEVSIDPVQVEALRIEDAADYHALETDPDKAERIYRWNIAREYDAHVDSTGTKICTDGGSTRV